jgi:hypothetical protein
MFTIAIGPSTEKEALSDLMIPSFLHLPNTFFASLGM